MLFKAACIAVSLYSVPNTTKHRLEIYNTETKYAFNIIYDTLKEVEEDQENQVAIIKQMAKKCTGD